MAEQLTLDQTSETAVDPTRLTPHEQWARACRLNPDLRQAFADCAHQLHDQGVRATANRVAEELRDRFRTVGDTYAFNNTWRSAAAEELRRRDPDAARDMRTRKATR